jgi:hypothetical protein
MKKSLVCPTWLMKDKLLLRKGLESNADAVVGPTNELQTKAVKTTPMVDHFGLFLFIVAFIGIGKVKHPLYAERCFSKIFTISMPLVRSDSVELPPPGALDNYKLPLPTVVLDADEYFKQGCIAYMCTPLCSKSCIATVICSVLELLE